MMGDLETTINSWKTAEVEVAEIKDLPKWKSDNWPIVLNLVTVGRAARVNILEEMNSQINKAKDLERQLELCQKKLRVPQDKLVDVQSDLINQFKETSQNLEKTVEKHCKLTESLQNNSEFIQSPETASKAIVVIDAIFKSIKTNSSVKLQN